MLRRDRAMSRRGPQFGPHTVRHISITPVKPHGARVKLLVTRESLPDKC